MRELRRVGIWSAARVRGAISGGVGLLTGALFLLLLSLGLVSASEIGIEGGSILLLAGLAAVAFLFLLPFFYWLLGLFSGAVAAVIYNLAARLAGGLEVELGGFDLDAEGEPQAPAAASGSAASQP